MIKHIVMFSLKETARGKSKQENALEAKERLLGFPQSIPSLRKIEVGINSKDASDKNFDIVLVCDFDDIEGLNEYIVHPVHVEFGKFMREIRIDRACVDYEY